MYFNEYSKPQFLIIIFLVVVCVTTCQPNPTQCILEFQVLSKSYNHSSCGLENWDGFLHQNCCGSVFNGYLYALSVHANKTGRIFLNSTEQRNCLASLKSFEKDVFGCGIEKLTTGGGGCSDFSVADVISKLGEELENLRGNCDFKGYDGEVDRKRGFCVRSWKEIRGESLNSASEIDICRFAVLVVLTSSRVEEEKWVTTVYNCLAKPDAFNTENEEPEGTRKTETSPETVRWVITGCLIGFALICAATTWILFKKWLKSSVPLKIYAKKNVILKMHGSIEFPVKEVHFARSNLNAFNLIGRGTAGMVYKVNLSNNQCVAVKHIINDVYNETFAREVTSLLHIRHQNLVALLGYCEEKDERFLVYELCPNGNLSEWLFGKDKVLSWIQRLELAIDSGRGLLFLHTFAQGCIVHRDIKPTNILLGAEFEAKLSDFGLSKVIDLEKSYVSSEVRGTFGYVDPEYQSNHHVNAYGDVYSFGIVLLQILSGQKVLNLNLKEPTTLDKMAKFLTKGGHIIEFADPKLEGAFSPEAFELTLKLALSCIGLKRQRPSMEHVVATLEKALEISTRPTTVTITEPLLLTSE